MACVPKCWTARALWASHSFENLRTGQRPMVSKRDVLDEIRRAQEDGWKVTKTGGQHYRLEHEEASRPVLAPSTPSDHRGILNLRADLRRVMPRKDDDKSASTHSARPVAKQKIHRKPTQPSQNFDMDAGTAPASDGFRWPRLPRYTPENAQADEEAAWWASLPPNAVLLAWRSAIGRMRASGADWGLVAVLKRRVRDDGEFRAGLVRRWLDPDPQRVAVNGEPAGIAFLVTPRAAMAGGHLPAPGSPEATLALLSAERLRAQVAERRVSALEASLRAVGAMARGHSGEYGDPDAERRRRAYAELARDDAMAALSLEREARGKAELRWKEAERRAETEARARAAAERRLADIERQSAGAGQHQRHADTVRPAGWPHADQHNGAHPGQFPLEQPTRCPPAPAVADRASGRHPDTVDHGVRKAPCQATRVPVTTLAAAAVRPGRPRSPVAAGGTLGERIYLRRKARGLTQVALAEGIGGSGPSISLWERDLARPSDEWLRRLARMLQTTVKALAGDVIPRGNG